MKEITRQCIQIADQIEDSPKPFEVFHFLTIKKEVGSDRDEKNYRFKTILTTCSQMEGKINKKNKPT